MKEAPLYVQSHDLARWLLTALGEGDALGRRLHEDGLRLLDAVVLALKGFERQAHIEEADALAALLRVRLRLACDLGRIDDRQLVHATGELDSIGRQLGVWYRRVARDTVPAHPR